MMEQWNGFCSVAPGFCFPIMFANSDSLESLYVKKHGHVVNIQSDKRGKTVYVCALAGSIL